MLSKLALRNAKRSMKDYAVYLLTVSISFSLMYAFNMVVFSKDIKSLNQMMDSLPIMISFISVIVIAVIEWLVHYMNCFMLEKRSREFATYLLIGLKKKELSRLYMKENLLVGTAAFFIGLGVGTLLQQIIMTVFYSIFSEDYKLHVQMNIWCLVMTAGCYFACYLFALMRNKKAFKKMSIAELLQMEKKNEEIKIGHEKLRQWLFPAAAAYIIFVYVMMVRGCSIWTALILMAGFVAAVYLLFHGLSAFMICRIQKRGRGMYRNNRIFVFRQMASKVRTMRFAMGTLTILLVCSLMGSAFAFMFARYQGQAADYSVPFDVAVHSPTPGDDFAEEISVSFV